MLGGPTHAASLAMKLWLAQRFGGAGRTLSSAPARAAGKAMESLLSLRWIPMPFLADSQALTPSTI